MRIAKPALHESWQELQLLADTMPALVTRKQAWNSGPGYCFVNKVYAELFSGTCKWIDSLLGRKDISVSDNAKEKFGPWLTGPCSASGSLSSSSRPMRTRHVDKSAWNMCPAAARRWQVEGL
jgi:hypothetical protein